jgi:hypothetical protein
MKTIEDVRSFFRELTGKHSLNFHPDTPFEDFDILTKTEAKAFNKKMEKSLEICEREHVDIYEIGIKILKEKLVKKAN